MIAGGKRLARGVLTLAVWMAVGGYFPWTEPLGGLPRLGAQQVFAPRAVFAQQAADEKDDTESPSASGDLGQDVFLRPPRDLLQRLAAAQHLLREERYDDAVGMLGSILDSAKDYFFQPDRQGAPELHQSIKGEVQRMIGRMPRRGRELYQLRFGATAQHLLDQAVESGDPAKLAEVSRRFFHTQAGYEATLLLGLDHLNHARPLAAALMLDRLRRSAGYVERFEPTLSLALATAWMRSGEARAAEEALTALRAQFGRRAVLVGGEPVDFGRDSSELLAWLEGLVGPPRGAPSGASSLWAMYRGDPTRNVSTHSGAPLFYLRWRVPASDHRQIDEIFGHLRRMYRQQDAPILPGLHPLAVDDTVLMRTARTLLAVDFRTGKRVWEVPVQNQLEQYLGDPTPPEQLFRQQSPASQAAMALAQRVWDDATYGTLSSDGRLVFSIEDLGPGVPQNPARTVILGGQRVGSEGDGNHNRLAAHDIRTGRLKWHLGGPNDQFALPMAETFFLGPPLPLMDQLFVLAEAGNQGAVELLALDPATGSLLWSQPLAVVEQAAQNVPADTTRRLSGASPSYADGVLVCPTATGAVVAVDLATRSLLWGYRYSRPQDARNRGVVFGAAILSELDDPASPRWYEPTVTIAEGCVVVTPTDSDALHCLGLADGKPRFRPLPRGDALYLAAVHRGKIVLVARNELRAVKLEGSGDEPARPAWDGRTVPLPDGAMPSGRGLLSGDLYYLPVDTGEVMAIDLVEGRIAARHKGSEGLVPGNLVCYQGHIISQGLGGLEVYYQIDTARAEAQRRLAVAPADPEGLVLRGEILKEEGRHAEAVAALREAYRVCPDARRRSLLRDTLIGGLASDFAAYRGAADEIESLLDLPEHQALFLRRMAEGLRAAGEHVAAFDHYMRLVDLDVEVRGLVDLTPDWSVRGDRWLRRQLAGLRTEASGSEAAEEMDRRIRARFETAAAQRNPDALRRFLDYFGDGETAVEARRALIDRLVDSGRILEVELLLWKDLASGDPSTAATATADLADALTRAGRDADAALCYRQLASRFAVVAGRDGRTGLERFDALPADSAVRKALEPPPAWHTGVVEVTKKAADATRQPTYGRFPMKFAGPAAPFYSDSTLYLDQNRRMLGNCDALGRTQWQVSLMEMTQNSAMIFNRDWTVVAARGHLLLVSLGHQLIALDASGARDGGSPKLLWQEDLTEPVLGAMAMRRMLIPMGNVAWAVQRFHMTRYGNRLSSVGPISGAILCHQTFRTLKAVDPLTGQTLWVRRDVPIGSELLGDDEFVITVPPEGDEALVYSALDGQLVDRVKTPRAFQPQAPAGNVPPAPFAAAMPSPAGAWVTTIGRDVVCWRVEDDGYVLQRYDLVAGKAVWERRGLPGNTLTEVIDDEFVSVCDPQGRLVLVGLADGRTIVDTTLEPGEPASPVAQCWVLRHGARFLVVTHNPPETDPAAQQANPAQRPVPQPVPGTFAQQVRRGYVYAFDAEGKPLWTKPVRIEDQQMILDQPAGLPVLVFATQVFLPDRTGTARFSLSIVALDKRTGREVCRYESEERTHVFDLTAHPDRQEVQIATQQHTITMTFTDRPVENESAGPEPVVSKDPETPKILRALFRGLTERSAENEE